MRKKAFKDYLTAEDHLQAAVVTYMRLKYPKVFFVHVPNEGKRSKFEQYKAKVLGITAGVPDLLIFKAGGLAIELKIKPNRPTDNQKKCLQQLENEGWRALVCYSFDEAIGAIDSHLSSDILKVR